MMKQLRQMFLTMLVVLLMVMILRQCRPCSSSRRPRCSSPPESSGSTQCPLVG